MKIFFVILGLVLAYVLYRRYMAMQEKPEHVNIKEGVFKPSADGGNSIK